MRNGFAHKLMLVKSTINAIVVETGERKISIAELALKLGYSPHYLKYQLLKHLALLDKCYQLDRDYVKYTC